jgi:hypothetical protein
MDAYKDASGVVYYLGVQQYTRRITRRTMETFIRSLCGQWGRSFRHIPDSLACVCLTPLSLLEASLPTYILLPYDEKRLCDFGTY